MIEGVGSNFWEDLLGVRYFYCHDPGCDELRFRQRCKIGVELVSTQKTLEVSERNLICKGELPRTYFCALGNWVSW